MAPVRSAVALRRVALVVDTARTPDWDPALPGVDFYAADIVLAARRAGMRSYVVGVDVWHKVPPGRASDDALLRAVQRGWEDKVASAAYRARAEE
eukprot:gene49976-15946_t